MKLYLDTEHFKDKPNKDKIKIISNTILNHKQEVTLEYYAEAIAVNGQTSVLCEYYDGCRRLSKTANIQKQELLMLDFDNKSVETSFSIEDMLKDSFIQKNAAFWYKTFSHKESDEVDRFRVVFALENPLLYNQQVEDMYRLLLSKYPMADKTCSTVNRLFFGSNTGYHVINFKNRLKTTDLEVSIFLVENKNKPTELTTSTPIWLLLKLGEFDLIQEKLGSTYAKKYSSLANARTIMKTTIDLREFLELPDTGTFNDIFHKDSEASSLIYRTGSGSYLYHCHSETAKFTGDIIQVVSRLTNKMMVETLNLLVRLTNSTFDTNSKISKIKSNSELFSSVLLDEDTKEVNPSLYKFLGNHVHEVVATLHVIVENSNEEEVEDDIIIVNRMGLKRISKSVSAIIGTEVTPQKISRVINKMAFLNIIAKLEQKDIPKPMLDLLLLAQANNRQPKLNSVYEVTSFSGEDSVALKVSIASGLADEIVKIGFSESSFNYEYLLSSFDRKTAERVFPQKVGVEISEQTLDIQTFLMNFITESILEKGFVVEQDVTEYANSNKKYGYGLTEHRWRQLRPSILQDYGLTRGRLTKALKEQFKVLDNSTSSPVILYFKKD